MNTTKTRFLIIFCLLLVGSLSYAQVALDESNSGKIISSCSGTYTDDGGRSIYSDSYDTDDDGSPDYLCWTFCPPHPINEGVRLTFLEWSLHPSDEFRIRDGKYGVCSHVPSSGYSPLIGTFTGHSVSQFDGSAGGTYAHGGGGWIESSPTNTSGCLTVEFRPDGDGNKGTGWKFGVDCLQDTIAPSKLFISEYYNNCDGDLYIELFNPTNEKISLKDFSLRRQSGTTFGSGANAYNLPDDDYIQPYSSYLVCKSTINSTVRPHCDASISIFGSSSWFTKIKCHDALGLFQKGFVIDQVGDQKKVVSSISVGGVSDAISNYTLIRKKDVDCGSVDWAASSGTNEPNSKWMLIPHGRFKNAGMHVFGSPKIFISEFYGKNIEDAYVEIYNGTGSTYSLDGLELMIAKGTQDWAGTAPSGASNYCGGWTQPSASANILSLSGSLQNQEVLVVCNNNANPNIICQSDIILNSNSSNSGQQVLSLADGNDAIGLFLNHVLIDVVGDPGKNTTHNIGRVTAATGHRVLVRGHGVRAGNCDWYDSSGGSFPDWNLLNPGNYSNLGAHRDTPTKCFEQIVITEVVNTKKKIAIGIMNKSTSSINLGKLTLKIGTTGNGWDNKLISLPSGRSLGPNKEFVIYQTLEEGFDNISSGQKMVTNQFFNGSTRQLDLDDAFAIVQEDGTILDVFGDPNQQNNGVGYKIAGISNALAYNVARRKSSIEFGNTKPMDSFGTYRNNSEWVLVNQTHLDGFGEANTSDAVPPVQYSITESETASCDGAGGSIQINAFGGTAPFTVFVNDIERPDGIVTGLATGNHSLNIRDPYGVSHRTTFLYTAPASETFEAVVETIQQPSCSGTTNGIAEVTSNLSQLSFRWSNGITTARNNNLSAGDHTVTVTSAAGCEKILTINLAEASTIIANLTGSPSICGNDGLGNIIATVSGGSGAYSYLWSNGSIAASLENVPNGNYSVTITDSQECTTSTSIGLIGPLTLEATATIVAPTCQRATGSITLTVSGGSAPYSYNWNSTGFESDKAVLTNVQGGINDVIIKDANGCEWQQSFAVDAISPINARVDIVKNVSCTGIANGQAIITSTQEGLQYLWEDGSTNAFNSNLAAGTHEVLVTNATNCSALLEVQIKESTNTDLTISLDKPISCANKWGQITAHIAGANTTYQYDWNTGHKHPAITIIEAGIYEVTVTDESGCSLTQSIAVENSEGQIFNQLAATVCEGTRYETSTNSYGTSGVYQERFSSVAGCDSIVEIQLTVLPLPALDLGANRTISDKDTIILAANHNYDQYNWSIGSTQSSIRIIGSDFSIGQHTIRLTARNESGCSVTDEIIITVKGSTDFLDPTILRQIQLYPNPTNGVVTIHDKNATFKPSLLQVFSAQGQLLQEVKLVSRQKQLELSNYSKGLYLLKITRERSVGFQKIIVK